MTAAPEQTTTQVRPHDHRRVLLKLSGEVFGGGKVGLAPDVVRAVAKQIAQSVREGIEVAVVIGGGNFFRGAELQHQAWTGRERTTWGCSAR